MAVSLADGAGVSVMQSESISSQGNQPNEKSDWKALVVRYQKPVLRRSVGQLANTLGPYVLLWVLLYVTQGISWWLTLALAVLAGAFLVRVFIIHHDCGHGSFFQSKRANDVWGFLTGVLTFTPYRHWRWEHAVHHATSGDLDRRGTGDLWTMTVQEYLSASRGRRLAYRLVRNPFVLFVIAPLYTMLGRHRFPKAEAGRRERQSVHWTNLAILAMAVGLSLLFGVKAYLVIQGTMILVAGSVGFWLFYVQHQFDGAYWEHGAEWDFTTAALQGSSFYKLPRVLQWFTGNIGYHHIHHLSARIPNYHLAACHQAEPLFAQVKPITLIASLKSLTYRLWDEQHRKLVGFGYLRTLRRSGPASG
jgi:omega-6 fatty acid desaturase (delta-12 desaturase)